MREASDSKSTAGLLYETITSHSLAYADEPLAETGENAEAITLYADRIKPDTLEQSDGRIPLNQWKVFKVGYIALYCTT